MTIRFVDAHCHLDHLAEAHPDRIGWLRDEGAAVVSWSFAHRVDSVADLTAYWEAQVAAVERAARGGLPCALLVGVHPRNIPADLAPERLADLLVPLLDHPLCRGIGEIGLETGSVREREVFEAQLALAPELEARGQVFGVHTPRGDKERVTREILAVLRAHPRAARRALVDHTTPVTAPWALDEGYRVGMSLSPVKSSADDLGRLLRNRPEAAERLCCSTDSGTRFFDDLWRLARDPGLPAETADRVLRANALAWFRPEAKVPDPT
ncbi:TatD family hydrolase [Deferrisoma palaeochoriense]